MISFDQTWDVISVKYNNRLSKHITPGSFISLNWEINYSVNSVYLDQTWYVRVLFSKITTGLVLYNISL